MKRILGIGLILGVMACGDLSDPGPDLSGKVSPEGISQSYSISLDTVIDANPAAQTTQNAATFAFSCTTPPCTFKCKLDKGDWKACTSPKSYAKLSSGSHAFRVKAIDSLAAVDDTPAVWS